ncbi:MAG: bifunctional UDP-N-acetylglucosamine diphosphorylase/glucosamine-1-phosphate N-acetyltransferase GlmU [Pseudomonadota bacterium]
MTQPITCIILAAGKGTRMKSQTHKVLHKVAGRSLLGHVLAGVEPLTPAQTVVVVGAGRDQVEAAIAGSAGVTTALQEPQYGTGHAVLAAKLEVETSVGITLILYGDVPFVPTDIMAQMTATAAQQGGPVILGFDADNPGAYGRLVLGADAMLERIVEAKDASTDELAITLCNSGIMAAPTEQLFSLLDAVGNNNAAGEYYLTDIVAIARTRRLSVNVVQADEVDVMGVNSRADLAVAEKVFQQQRRQEMMDGGVTLQAPDTVFFQADTTVGPDVVIEQNVVFGPGVSIESGAIIRAFSHLEGCHVESGASVGPYARLRPGAQIGANAKVGNFVEVKNARLAAGAKASHLSYIGDADVGQNANIGAGTITCNYDGYFKYRTVIGSGAFIGSNTSLIAPVTIGENAITGAGSAIAKDVEAGALGITRAPQSTKAGWASRFMAMMSAKKAAKKKSA